MYGSQLSRISQCWCQHPCYWFVFLSINNNNNNNNTSTHIFVPFVIETSGAWNAQAIQLTLGRRTTAVTGDPLQTNHLFQRLSIAIQQANAVSFTSTFKSE